MNLLNDQGYKMRRQAAGDLGIFGTLGALAVMGQLLVLAGLGCRSIGKMGKRMGKRTLLHEQQSEYQQYSGE